MRACVCVCVCVSGSVGFTRRAGATRLTYASIAHMLALFPTAVPDMTLSNEQLQPPNDMHTGSEPQTTQSSASSEAGIPSQAAQGAGHTSSSGQAVQGLNTVNRPVTAVVFGREESGLTEDELRWAYTHTHTHTHTRAQNEHTGTHHGHTGTHSS